MAEKTKDTEKHEKPSIPEDSKERGGNYVLDAWLVLVMALVFGGALTLVQITLDPIIEQNQFSAAFEQIPMVVPGAVADDTSVETIGDLTAFRAMSGQNHVGWAIRGVGSGYVDDISVLIGLDADAEIITGIHILQQQETPGLGDKITEESWRKQFEDKSSDKTLEVTKQPPSDPSHISNIAGATVSAEAVTDIVNKTIQRFKSNLAQQ